MYWIRYQRGLTALNAAANLGHTDIAKLLIDGGADVNSRDNTVSDIIRGIVVIFCLLNCVVESCNGTISSSLRHH